MKCDICIMEIKLKIDVVHEINSCDFYICVGVRGHTGAQVGAHWLKPVQHCQSVWVVTGLIGVTWSDCPLSVSSPLSPQCTSHHEAQLDNVIDFGDLCHGDAAKAVSTKWGQLEILIS